MLRGDSKVSQLADEAKIATLELRRFEKDTLLNMDNKPVMQGYQEKWKTQLAELRAIVSDLDARVASDSSKQLVAAMDREIATYERGVDAVVAGINDGTIKTPQQGNAKVTEVKEEIHRMEAAATDLSEKHRKIMADNEETITAFARQTAFLMFTVVLVTFIVATLVTLVVSRGITRPVKAMADHLGEMAQGGGDLTRRIEIVSHDEVGQMANSFNSFVKKLEEIISEVRLGSDGIASAAAQVAASAASLSQGTSEQAASIEETTSSLEQMSASITQNAENSRQMEQMALKGARDGEESGGAVRESVTAMKQIAEKISIIEEIAYQTSLLALAYSRNGFEQMPLVVQEQEFERLGSARTIQVSVRMIATTHRNLENMVEDGGFREDLFYRLNVFPIEIPPLRERREDIPLLVNYFVSKLARRMGKKINSTALAPAVIFRNSRRFMSNFQHGLLLFSLVAADVYVSGFDSR
jgi:methyl-accepting chemotaxis protein